MIETQNIKWPTIILALFAMVMCLGVWQSSAHAATPLAANVNVTVDGNPLNTDVPPVIVQDRTLVPLRAVGEAVGGSVDWDPVQRRAIVQLENRIVIVPLGEHFALVDGQPAPLDVPAQIVNDRTMVPLRFIVEALGAELEWNAETRTVTILRQAVRITNMAYRQGEGRAWLSLILSEPLKRIEPTVDGDSLLLNLYPATLDLDQPELTPLDTLVKRIGLTANGRMVTLRADFWSVPTYRYYLSPDGLRLTVELDYMVTGVQARTENRIPIVDINTSGPVKYSTLQLKEPDRLVVDIEGVTLASQAPKSVEVGQGFVTRIRTAQNSVNPNRVRVVLDLGASVLPEVTTTEYGLKLRFLPQITAVKVVQVQGTTRITLPGTMPLDAQAVLAADKRSLTIDLPQAKSALAQPTIELKEGAVSHVSVAAGASKDSLRITLSLPYYIGHKVVSKPGDSQVVLEFISSPIYGRRIFIDPGHGGTDPGAIGTTHQTYEKIVNLAISLELKKLLEQAGGTVLMTRTADADVSLQDRVDLANSARPAADVFISIHHNSAANASARGIETYYWHTNPKSRTLADRMQAALLIGMGLPDRRVRTEEFYVIKHTTMPSILVEMGYLTNPDEEKGMIAPTYASKSAIALRDGIFAYFWQEIRAGITN